MKKNRLENPGVHLLYKNLGETPNEAVLRFKDQNPEYKDVSMTYAGRLDPMAEGLLLVLSGDAVYEKDKYLDLPKTYEFQVLWSVSTDTLDVLGISEKSESVLVPEVETLKEKFEESIEKFEQIYPVYSSRPVNGKSLFQWAREGRIKEIDIPKHDVELYSAEHLGREKIGAQDLLKNILDKVSLVKGDFRQEEITKRWKEVLEGNREYVFDTIRIKVSSGFYVRQFVADMAEGFGIVATTFHIKRTQIGDYC